MDQTSKNIYAICTMVFSTLIFATIITLAVGAPYPPNFPSNGTEEALSYIRSINPEMIILDVDAGVDDATAILLALANPQPGYPEVVAITCTHGNTDVHHVVINVLKTLKVLKKKIPVYIGAYSGLTTRATGDSFYGKDGFGDVSVSDPPTLDEAEKEHAVFAMIQLVKQNPGKIAIVATGPLSNVALAIRLDPTFKENLHALYWMGGSTIGVGNIKPGIEFNAFMDPEANYIVMNATGPPVVLLSWETCTFNGMVPKDWRINVLGKLDSPYVHFLNQIETVALNKTVKWAACDPKLMSIVLDPYIATKASILNVDAVYQGDARGALLTDYKGQIRPRNVVIVQDFNAEAFKELLLNNLATKKNH